MFIPDQQTGRTANFERLWRFKILLSRSGPANRNICESLLAAFSRAPITDLELDYGPFQPFPNAGDVLWTSLTKLTLRASSLKLTEPVCASFVTPLLLCQSLTVPDRVVVATAVAPPAASKISGLVRPHADRFRLDGSWRTKFHQHRQSQSGHHLHRLPSTLYLHPPHSRFYRYSSSLRLSLDWQPGTALEPIVAGGGISSRMVHRRALNLRGAVTKGGTVGAGGGNGVQSC